jgi:hypothetical protein
MQEEWLRSCVRISGNSRQVLQRREVDPDGAEITKDRSGGFLVSSEALGDLRPRDPLLDVLLSLAAR